MTANRYSSFDSKSVASNAPKDYAGNLESEFFLKNITTPSGMLVLYFYAVHGLVVENQTDYILQVSFTIGTTTKVTAKRLFNKAAGLTIFNEIKYIPFLVNSVSTGIQPDKLVISVLLCHFGERPTVIGVYEILLRSILKAVTTSEKKIIKKAQLWNKKGEIVGEIEFECGATYGEFGYGQSYQLMNKDPVEVVKMSLLPRILPENEVAIRGTCVSCQRVKHPAFIPIVNELSANLETGLCDPIDIDASALEVSTIEDTNFLFLKKHMLRIGQLNLLYAQQKTRLKRLFFIKTLLEEPVVDSCV